MRSRPRTEHNRAVGNTPCGKRHACILVILQPPNPKNYVVSLVLYGPVEAGIGWNVSGWHCRRSSTLNNIGGVNTRTFFKLAECYL